MTDLPAPPAAANAASAPPAPAEPRARHAPVSQLALIVGRTMGRWGARLGVVWLVLLALLAVFAPLVASSHPLVLKTVGGGWSSPWLEHLSPADVILPVVTVLALVLCRYPRRWSGRRRFAALAVVVAVVTPLAYLTVQPPATVVYDRYRQMERAGQIEHAVYAPIRFSPGDRQRDDLDARLLPPSTTHFLGTTVDGEDVASRMIHACRIAMSIGFIATGISLIIGITLGGLMGYFSGVADLLGMRLVEIFEAVPRLYLLLAFVAFFGRGPYMLYFIMVIIGLTSWTGYARFTRAEFLRLRAADYVTAGRALGLPLWSILFRHMLPNGVAPVLVSASFGIAAAIEAEATLSFLGLGLVDEPSWGQLLNQAVGAAGGFRWWIAVFPGLAIFLTVFAYNLLGESLRDAIDVKR